ncbi:MAG TPA: hypothetical protein VEL50_02500 [Gemmatimonadales bacterium]|nr:hypothetical protein [Gemmatimonadales bacterium]
MTYGISKTSVAEERLVRYLRVCDYLFYWGFGTGIVGVIGWRSVRVLGLGLGFMTYGAAAKLAGVVIAYLMMSSRTPNAEIAPWIRQWTRATSVIAFLAAMWALIAGPDSVVRLLALAVAVVCVLLYRRVGSLAIGDLGEQWGPATAQGMFPLGSFGAEIGAWLTAAWLVLAIVVRVSMPSLFRASEQKVHPDELKMRVLAVVNAESRYHRVHGSYSSDIVELRRLGFSLIDSLVVVTADDRSYRAVARDPGGGVSCGLWSATRIGERTPLQIEGVAPDQLVCWTAPDSSKKAR